MDQGTLRISWWNRNASEAPRYSVTFARHGTGGSMPYKVICGLEALEQFLFELQSVDLPVEGRESSAKGWAAEVQMSGSYSLLLP
jgi:hypothetical protein